MAAESVVAGEHRLGIREGSEQKVRIYRVFIHHSYNSKTVANDIALLKLRNELRFDKYTQPACLPEKSKCDHFETNVFATIMPIIANFFVVELNNISGFFRKNE